MRRAARTAAAVAALALCLGAAPAARATEPLFSFTGPSVIPASNPFRDFRGPCGLAVDGGGRLYVSAYYNDAFYVFAGGGLPAAGFVLQKVGIDPLDGPCGLAVDAVGRLYVNSYHRQVLRFLPSSFPPSSNTTYGPPTAIDTATPTGVAVEPATGRVFVDDRTHVAVYDSAGAPMAPFQIGAGSIGDGYGVAVSATSGLVYVPDAADDVVEVYNPDLDPDHPVATISGPPGGFSSLVDSAVAVDDQSGDVYVSDRLSSRFTEHPEAAIHVFDATGAYQGRLKYNVVYGAPVGLAVDNSAQATNGRVYVTSGNAAGGRVLVYPRGAATTVAAPPLGLPGDGLGKDGNEDEMAGADGRCAHPCGGGAPVSPKPERSVTVEDGPLRLSLAGELAPRRLSRQGGTPVGVEVGWKIATTDGSPPPTLKSVRLEINRNGRFHFAGLPVCPYAKIHPASTARALANCRSALVGMGRFEAIVGLGGQEPYASRGRMLLFNGRERGRHVLFGQMYSAYPFASSFAIRFDVENLGGGGAYGTALTARLPRALREWGSLVEVDMRLYRRFTHAGRRHSFLTAGCPTPEGPGEVLFFLARASFDFTAGYHRALNLLGSCKGR